MINQNINRDNKCAVYREAQYDLNKFSLTSSEQYPNFRARTLT